MNFLVGIKSPLDFNGRCVGLAQRSQLGALDFRAARMKVLTYAVPPTLLLGQSAQCSFLKTCSKVVSPFATNSRKKCRISTYLLLDKVSRFSARAFALLLSSKNDIPEKFIFGLKNLEIS